MALALAEETMVMAEFIINSMVKLLPNAMESYVPDGLLLSLSNYIVNPSTSFFHFTVRFLIGFIH